MTRQSLQVVQFVHPGFEYHRAEHVGGRTQRSGVMPWKLGRSRHDRKFMLTCGSLFDPGTGEDQPAVPLGFWGEWEGPSVFWRVASPGRTLPRIVHAPFRPARWPTTPVQNTDPMVFGDAFIYSNCLQGTYRSLRTLSPGSMVLFGRFARTNGRPSFSLDTCLVIERMQTLAPAPIDPGNYGDDLLTDAVLGRYSPRARTVPSACTSGGAGPQTVQAHTASSRPASPSTRRRCSPGPNSHPPGRWTASSILQITRGSR
jgi:hypothetical protein